MKNYGKFIIIGIILILLIPIFGFGEDEYEERELLMGILETTGANFEEGDICLGGTILDRFIGTLEIKDIGYSIRDMLNIGTDGSHKNYYWEDLIEDDGFIQFTVQGLDGYNNFVTITLSSYKDVEYGSGETTLFINFINREKFDKINDIILEVEKFFDEYNKPVNITTCIIGSFDDKVDAKRNEEKILEVTELIEGYVVEEYKEDDILSFSIFTPYIEEYVFTGNKKMNLNIAVRFSEYDNKTYIWIGTPIITIGY
ncbi:YwmB family TATA-box binding protein [Tepidimicrobium xylanilyticum]|uniref:TATA-box binding n=1 Tax=Tepidimicrobium xylanilyticum TaxID=1123352 RepID=A0A1H2R0G8_9FIRM|nr:YwmB family TATA-box binding protein [Tepidimicrobium xylanilyticum]SDW12159.1 TATA-box binding [Tepidimicrobium xylanilyticum]